MKARMVQRRLTAALAAMLQLSLIGLREVEAFPADGAWLIKGRVP
jgi:hypothetical protein